MKRKMICLAALSASLMAGSACDGDSKARPAAPTAAPTPTPPTPPPFSRPELAGAYTLTVEADSKCVDLPAAAKKRIYQAWLEVTGYSYLAIEIVGGGYTEPRGIGELWNNGLIGWNNFDEACDGYEEPLGPSSTLMICGSGAAQEGSSTIRVPLSGQIWVDETVNGATQQTSLCIGVHQLTFQRTASN
jgi:hypothetical protein